MSMSRRHLLGGMIGTPMSTRLIDPVEQINRGADEDHGIITPRSLTQRQDAQERFTAESSRTQRYLIFETLDFHKFDAPANTDSLMATMIAGTATTFLLSTVTPDVSQQCRISALRIMSTANITAGTAIPVISVTEGGSTTDYPFDECELSTTDPRVKSVVFEWPSAIQMAKGATWYVILRTDASFAPTTADIKVLVTLGYDQGAFN